MRLSDPKPAYCSSCFSQPIDATYVDLEAYFDGPVIDEANGIKQAIDDLHLCEGCLRSAGALIGLSDSTALKERNVELAVVAEALEAKVADLESHIADLSTALVSKPAGPAKRVFQRG